MKHLTSILDTAKNIGKSTLSLVGKPLTYISLLGALAAPLVAQPDPDDYPPEINTGDMLNPYKQPNDRSLRWYGSGDANDDGVITYDGDVVEMQLGTQNDMADIDGDGTPSTDEDITIMQQYFGGDIPYLPGWWNRLESREERESWLEKMLAIDQTDTITWVNGTVEERFISGNFATQLVLNFYDFDKQNPEDNDIPAKYDTTNLGRFNIPLYIVSVSSNESNWGHGMNAVLLGENPLNFYDWSFVEPQNDSLNLVPPTSGMPYNSIYRIQGMLHFNQTGSPDMPFPFNVVRFLINEVGEDSLYYDPPEGFITERPDWISDFPEGLPTVGLDTRGFAIPNSFELYPNYPNPFNGSTTIRYEIPVGGHVNISVYNSNGQLVRKLVEGNKNPGTHIIDFDGTNLPSGLYISRLQAGNHSDSKKMLLIK